MNKIGGGRVFSLVHLTWNDPTPESGKVVQYQAQCPYICEMRITALLITTLVINEQNHYIYMHDTAVHAYVEQ
jgi:hypothetical protein